MNQEEECKKIDNFTDLSKISIEELLTTAEKYVEEVKYENAEIYYQEGFKKGNCPENFLYSYGNFSKLNNQPNLAKELFEIAIKSYPEKNFKNYMELAELNNGLQAIKLYEKGIEILILEEPNNKRDLSQSYSAIAEIYQTDLLKFAESESKCLLKFK